MDGRQLRTFLKIIELGSITRAADALGIAQPSLSQQVLRLEDEVGIKLFLRTARGVTTTEGGRIFEEHARRILNTMDQALRDVQQLNDDSSGKVSFAMPGSVCRVLGVTLVEAVLNRAPRVSLRLIEAFSGHIRTWIDEGSIDLGILYDIGPMRHLSLRRLAREELYLVGPPGRFGDLETAPSVAAEEITALQMILPSPQHGLRQFLDREASRLGISLNVLIEIDALPHITQLVANGRGCTVLSLPAVRDDLAAGRVSVARIEDGAIKRTLCLVRNPTSEVTRASIRVEDLALKIMRRLIVTGRWSAEPESSLNAYSPDEMQDR
jgi:LysR family nitrogen assimilation transcriptional regulator